MSLRENVQQSHLTRREKDCSKEGTILDNSTVYVETKFISLWGNIWQITSQKVCI